MDELKQKLQQIAWNKAEEILSESGCSENDEYYALRKYEIQFVIYEQLKMCHKVK